MSIEFNEQQIHVLYEIENWWDNSADQVYELSGVAGAGKTTLIKYFIEYMGIDWSSVAFVAFMGKAAIQMARNGLPAQTIHSLIYNYEEVPDLDENGNIQINERYKVKMKKVFVKRKKIPKHIKLIVVDEAGMVSEKIARDLLSYGVPVIALGDLNQLPPVFGAPFFLKKPNFHLTKIMRQAENNPIVWLANQVLDGKELTTGVYGKSSVIKKTDLNEFILNDADVVLTGTNRLRHEINTLFRENIKNIKKLDVPNIGEKIICRKNNWNRCIDNCIYLANGLSGFVEYVDMESFDGKGLKIDFRPDFMKKQFKNVVLDYKKLFASHHDDELVDKFAFTRDHFEFAYAITVHLSQGSQYDNVLFLNERTSFDKETYKKLQYTAITRAMKKITIAI